MKLFSLFALAIAASAFAGQVIELPKKTQLTDLKKGTEITFSEGFAAKGYISSEPSPLNKESTFFNDGSSVDPLYETNANRIYWAKERYCAFDLQGIPSSEYEYVRTETDSFDKKVKHQNYLWKGLVLKAGVSFVLDKDASIKFYPAEPPFGRAPKEGGEIVLEGHSAGTELANKVTFNMLRCQSEDTSGAGAGRSASLEIRKTDWTLEDLERAIGVTVKATVEAP
jgi:hypothetical protein